MFIKVSDLIDEMNEQVLNLFGVKFEKREAVHIVTNATGKKKAVELTD